MRRQKEDAASFTPVLLLTEKGGIKCLFGAIDSKHHKAAYPSSHFLSQREKTQQEDREQGNEEGLESSATQEALQLRKESVWSPCFLADFQFLTPCPSVAWLSWQQLRIFFKTALSELLNRIFKVPFEVKCGAFSSIRTRTTRVSLLVDMSVQVWDCTCLTASAMSVWTVKLCWGWTSTP